MSGLVGAMVGVPEPAGVLAASLAALAVTLGVPSAARQFARPRVLPGTVAAAAPGVGSDPGVDPLERHPLLVSILAGVAPVLFLGGPVGLLAGIGLAVAVHRTLRRREPTWERRRREQVARDLPHAVDLLAVALAAGAAPSTALGVVAGAVEGPIAAELAGARHALTLGLDPVRVWRELGRRPGLAALGRTMARATETGASVGDALHRLAEDLQLAARAEAERRARTIGVRAAAPLGLCLLPAFVLVGVVPLVAGTVTALLGQW